MTTTVTVTAHCTNDIEVVIDVVAYTSDYEAIEFEKEYVIQNLQTHSENIYGTKQIRGIYERRKK